MYQLQLFLHVRPATWQAITGMALCHKNVWGQWSNAWKVWKTLRPIEYISGLRVCMYVCYLMTKAKPASETPCAFDKMGQCGKSNICSTSKLIPVETRSHSVRCSVSQKTWERIPTFILCRLRMEFLLHKIPFRLKKKRLQWIAYVLNKWTRSFESYFCLKW